MDTSEQFGQMLDKAIEAHPEAFQGFDRTKNVQDQLQAMAGNVEDLPFTILEVFYEYVKGLQWNENPSYEQLWLAFLLAEKYGKYWNGSDWVLME